jgi:hypothetical protein
MTFRVFCSLLLAVTFATRDASAQTDAGVSASGLLTIQPVDNFFANRPYVDHGIGGLSPGLAAGVSVMTPVGLVLIGEFSTANLQQLQQGRLVDSIFNVRSSTVDTRIRDSLWSGLIGYATRGPSRRLIVTAGASRVTTTITADVPMRTDPAFERLQERRQYAITVGADLLSDLGSRTSLMVGGRYTVADRSTAARQLGAGPHIVRLSAGIRFRLWGNVADVSETSTSRSRRTRPLARR